MASKPTSGGALLRCKDKDPDDDPFWISDRAF